MATMGACHGDGDARQAANQAVTRQRTGLLPIEGERNREISAGQIWT